MGGLVVGLIVSGGWGCLAGAGGDGFCAVFAGDVDPSVVALAAEGWWGFGGGWGGGWGVLVVEPAFGVEPCGGVGDVLGVFGAGDGVKLGGFDDGGGGGFSEGSFPCFSGCAFSDFAWVVVPERFESIIFG